MVNVLRIDTDDGVDCIGDIHGCIYTLIQCLTDLGYVLEMNNGIILSAVHGENRTLVFLGDYIDRGNFPFDVLRSVKNLTKSQHRAIMGNHDLSLMKDIALFLRYNSACGTRDSITDGKILDQFHAVGEESLRNIMNWLESLPLEIEVVHAGQLSVIASHGGTDINESKLDYDRDDFVWGRSMQYERRKMRQVSSHDKSDWDVYEWPDWTSHWTTRSEHTWSVSGHTPLDKPIVAGHLAMIDTGACFGGGLTAFRYPECQTVTTKTAEIDMNS